MKQYDGDRTYPERAAEREKNMKKSTQKVSKKMSIPAMAYWHNLNIDTLVK